MNGCSQCCGGGDDEQKLRQPLFNVELTVQEGSLQFNTPTDRFLDSPIALMEKVRPLAFLRLEGMRGEWWCFSIRWSREVSLTSLL